MTTTAPTSSSPAWMLFIGGTKLTNGIDHFGLHVKFVMSSSKTSHSFVALLLYYPLADNY